MRIINEFCKVFTNSEVYFKKVLIIIGCFIFLSPSDPSDQWIELPWSNEDVIHKCRREDYLNLIDESGIIEMKTAHRNYIKWEFDIKFRNRKQAKIKLDSIMKL